jgi:hypothetical protein
MIGGNLRNLTAQPWPRARHLLASFCSLATELPKSPRQESNLHAVGRPGLNRMRLPFHHSGEVPLRGLEPPRPQGTTWSKHVLSTHFPSTAADSDEGTRTPSMSIFEIDWSSYCLHRRNNAVGNRTQLSSVSTVSPCCRRAGRTLPAVTFGACSR